MTHTIVVGVDGSPTGLRALQWALAQATDLLVVGSHGHSSLVNALLGSVSAECVRHATCPVVVIPPPRKTTPGPVDHADAIAAGRTAATSSGPAGRGPVVRRRGADAAHHRLGVHIGQWRQPHLPVGRRVGLGAAAAADVGRRVQPCWLRWAA
jgi:Universal stress protein family